MRRWLAPAFPALAFVALVVWTWGKWPEAFIDFGRELYVPWRLAEGQRLYEDVAYFNGPLSPWLNAALFRIFGVSLRTLVLTNLAITALIAVVIWRLLRLYGSRPTAAAASVVFLTLFAFGQFMPGGAYNFIAPYSHEATHGTLLAGLALLLLARHVRHGRRWTVFACGLCLGLVALGKPELLVATATAIVAGLGLHHVLRSTPAREGFHLCGLFVAGAVLPLLAAFLLLLPGRGTAEALRDLSGPWAYVFDAQVTQSKFYRDLRGTSNVARSLGTIAAWTLGYVAAFGLAALPALRRGRTLLLGALSVMTAAAVALAGWQWGNWENCLRPLPVLLLVALLLAARSLSRTRDALSLAFLLFALLLPLKTWLNVRPLHYGFVLALPATLTFVVLLLEKVPAWVAQREGQPAVFRAGALAVLAVAAGVQLRATERWLDRKTVRLGTGADAFLADAREERVATLVDRMMRLRRPGETLVMLPEGAMVPYLTRTPGSIPYFQFMPPELAMYGEDRIVTALDRRPPDWMVLVHRPLSEYGYRVMGDDYALKIMGWAVEHYVPVDHVFVRDARGQEVEYALLLGRKPA